MGSAVREDRTPLAKDRLRSGVPAAAAIYDDLRARIVNFELEPDRTISRVDLAREYGVSQTPVREALQQLEQDGLMKIYPQSKTVVSRIDLSQLLEAHFLRVSIECEAARRLALTPNPSALAKAQSILTMQEAIAADLEQVEMFNDLDESFHQTLLEGVGQPNLHTLLRRKSGHLARLRRLDGQIARERRLVMLRKAKVRDILKAHQKILDAIGSGSPEAAMDAMREHLSGTIGRLEVLKKEHPAMFDD